MSSGVKRKKSQIQASNAHIILAPLNLTELSTSDSKYELRADNMRIKRFMQNFKISRKVSQTFG